MRQVKVRNIEIGAGIPKICVPIAGVTDEEIMAAAEAVRDSAADLAEWRADWYEIYRGAGIYDMCVLSGSNQNGVLALSSLSDYVAENDESGVFFDSPPFRYWLVRDVDFNEHVNVKYLTGVDYCTDTPFTLGVVADGKTFEYRLDPSRKYARLAARGRCFDFYIKCSSRDVKIKPFGVTVDFLRRTK